THDVNRIHVILEGTAPGVIALFVVRSAIIDVAQAIPRSALGHTHPEVSTYSPINDLHQLLWQRGCRQAAQQDESGAALECLPDGREFCGTLRNRKVRASQLFQTSATQPLGKADPLSAFALIERHHPVPGLLISTAPNRRTSSCSNQAMWLIHLP